jgi:hypothetical protein
MSKVNITEFVDYGFSPFDIASLLLSESDHSPNIIHREDSGLGYDISSYEGSVLIRLYLSDCTFLFRCEGNELELVR